MRALSISFALKAFLSTGLSASRAYTAFPRGWRSHFRFSFIGFVAERSASAAARSAVRCMLLLGRMSDVLLTLTAETPSLRQSAAELRRDGPTALELCPDSR